MVGGADDGERTTEENGRKTKRQKEETAAKERKTWENARRGRTQERETGKR
jgi:hypothetical protein